MTASGEPSLDERARRIRLVLMDVDGVLTDGSLVYLPDGTEAKAFHARDGAGIKMAQKAGLLVGILSGRASTAAARRAEELQLDEVHLHVLEKVKRYEEVIERRGLSDEQVCYIGDDVVDLGVMTRAGLAAAPCDAHPDVLPVAAVVTERAGGFGAVREVIDRILRAQDKWRDVTRPFR